MRRDCEKTVTRVPIGATVISTAGHRSATFFASNESTAIERTVGMLARTTIGVCAIAARSIRRVYDAAPGS
jgi:hypothetical protein